MKAFAIAASAPPAPSVRRIMATVLLALLPGVLASAAFFGRNVFAQIALAVAFALGFELIMLKLRAQPMIRFFTDLSAPVTAVLFALFIPPSAPWWIAAVGMCVAIVFAKHLYGGLGHNLFNPAMAGVVAVWLCFPHQHMLWSPPSGIGTSAPGEFGSRAWLWIAFCYGLGGMYLLWKKVIPWQTPVATLGAAILLTAPFWFQDSNFNPFSSQPVFTATLILAAFFIATDPVTGCASPRGRFVFGAGAGVLSLLIRHWSDDAAALASALLLMNCMAPWIDRHARPARINGSNQGSPA